jgi:hypothetical protein
VEFEMSQLVLTLKKKWFDMYLAGIKKEEYREMKPFWHKRLLNKSYTSVKFINGYGNHRPWIVFEFRDLLSGLGIIEWGAPPAEQVYIIRVGEILETGNLK